MRFEVDTVAVAGMVGVPPHTIRNWASRGRIQPLRAEGNRTIYDVEAVVEVAAAAGYLPDPARKPEDRYCCSDGCKAVVWPDMDVPLCPQHALAVWLRVTREIQKQIRPKKRAAPVRPLVYFIQAGDLIKIGTTTCLPGRLSALATHGSARLQLLLAVPGGRTEERQVHALFADERVRGEWFEPSDRLLEFIEKRRDLDARGIHGQSLHDD